MDSLRLKNNSCIAVVGGGPAGSFFSYFLLDLAERSEIKINVEIFEQKKFSELGPTGCNHCGGIISESLVQILSSEGIVIPSSVFQRGIDSYILHMETGSTRIETPLKEKRIAAVFRGAGPLGAGENAGQSFDSFLLDLAKKKGALHVDEKVTRIHLNDGFPVITTKEGSSKTYDLVAGSVGLLKSSLELFQNTDFGYHPPLVTKTYICEFPLGAETVRQYFGNSMHVFLLNIPRLDFAALIPKGDFVTLVLLGRKIDKNLVHSFLTAPEVIQCFPPNMNVLHGYSCQCYPKINIKSAVKPYADRIVLLGDCATSKLYKNGIGAAYLTARAAASTAVLHGISSGDFETNYWPACKSISKDNLIGKVIFMVTGIMQKFLFTKRGIQRMVVKEQRKKNDARLMSLVLWDTFTGSDTYLRIFLRTLKPAYILTLFTETLAGLFKKEHQTSLWQCDNLTSTLGKIFNDGEVIVSFGESGDCMFVIQSGTVEIIQKKGKKDVFLAQLYENDFFGEMALFDREIRSATVRAKGEARVLTIDKKTLLSRIQEDPVIAFRILENMSKRIRETNTRLSRIKSQDRRNWETRVDRSDT